MNKKNQQTYKIALEYVSIIDKTNTSFSYTNQERNLKVFHD